MPEIRKTPDGYALVDGSKSVPIRWCRAIRRWQYMTPSFSGVAGLNRDDVVRRAAMTFSLIDERMRWQKVGES